MNNKEIKALLKKKADKVKIKDCSREIIRSAHYIAPAQDTAKVNDTKKANRWWIPVCGVAVAACLMILIIPMFLPDVSPIDNHLTVGKAEEVLSYEMIALGNAISEVAETNSLAANQSQTITLSTQPLRMGRGARPLSDSIPLRALSEEDYARIAESINDYLLTGNALLAKSRISTAYERNTEDEYSSYEYKMLVSYEDAQSYRINYTVYYNETEKNETETELIGLFILNDRAYPMRGEKSVENDECEMELTIYMEENTYISVSNETSINENEYEYTYVEDGVVVKDVSMSISSENGESKTEIELTENGKTVEYEFVYSSEIVECEYKSEEGEFEIKIYIRSDYYLYEFEDGYCIELKKTFQ